MTITIRGQILAALRNNPGLNSARIASMIGMTTKKISGPLSTLFADGLIEFEGKHGQRLYRLTSYGMKYAPETILPCRREIRSWYSVQRRTLSARSAATARL